MAEGEDRTLPASERRRQRAREEGQVPLSRELVTMSSLAGALIVLGLVVPSTVPAFAKTLRGLFLATDAAPGHALQRAGFAILAGAGPFIGMAVLIGPAAVLLQTGFLFSTARLTPDVGRLSVRSGFRRVFGFDNGIEALKAIAKLAVLGWAVWTAFQSFWPAVPGALFWTTGTLVERVGVSFVRLGILVLAAQAGIAVLDTAWVRWRFSQRLQMSREELRQESRESDGDPRLKGKLKQLRMQRARRRMMAAVAKATVVVTNPTHYAVALVYERGTTSAPRVVAKGADEMAARIRATAEKSRVPLVANPPLARALYLVPLDAEVPAEHFKIVAEIIAYVWRLRGLTPRSGPSGQAG